MICSVPDEGRAYAAKNCLENEVSPLFPASTLRNTPTVSYIWKDSASIFETKAPNSI